jgi:hypothetical protein
MLSLIGFLMYYTMVHTADTPDTPDTGRYSEPLRWEMVVSTPLVVVSLLLYSSFPYHKVPIARDAGVTISGAWRPSASHKYGMWVVHRVLAFAWICMQASLLHGRLPTKDTSRNWTKREASRAWCYLESDTDTGNKP